MIFSIEFDLPAERDHLDHVLKAEEYRGALEDLAEYLRGFLKYQSPPEVGTPESLIRYEERIAAFKTIRDELAQSVADRDLGIFIYDPN